MATAGNNSDVRVRVYDLMTFITRLTQLLSEEIALLTDGGLEKVADLQQEKMRLASALEAQRRVIELHPESTSGLGYEDEENLRAIMSALQCILKENHRRLLEGRALSHGALERIHQLTQPHSGGMS